jgi:hypothetical protein
LPFVAVPDEFAPGWADFLRRRRHCAHPLELVDVFVGVRMSAAAGREGLDG